MCSLQSEINSNTADSGGSKDEPQVSSSAAGRGRRPLKWRTYEKNMSIGDSRSGDAGLRPTRSTDQPLVRKIKPILRLTFMFVMHSYSSYISLTFYFTS